MKTNAAKSKIDDFKKYLFNEQKSKSTIKTYLRAIALFFAFMDGNTFAVITNEILTSFKENLINSLASASSNTYIVGFNAFLSYIQYKGMRLKCIKRQSKDYVSFPLIDAEYNRLIETARTMGSNICALFRTLAGTGIRVSELRFITVEAVRAGQTEVNNKGKIRTLMLSKSVCEILTEYCAENNITSGVIFTGRDGVSPLSTGTIWRKINSLSEKTRIDKKKLHPHNLRHFFAGRFMKMANDINVLSNILGHSDIKTTTIYMHPGGDYIRRCIDKVAV